MSSTETKTDPGHDGISRRSLLHGAMLPLATTAPGWPVLPAAAQSRGRSAVVYLSRSGNTRVIAEALSRRFGAEIFEVLPRDPWPADYDEMVAWASRMRESSTPLPLAGTANLAEVGTVFLGSPTWGMALPAPMQSFLAGHDLAGKSVLPFVTHGGYGPGDSIETMRGMAPEAAFADPLVLRCDQERNTLDRMTGWLDSVADNVPK